MNHIAEGRRYISNAKKILRENGGKSGRFYSDPKYIRMAGDTAWKGVLEALKEVVPLSVKDRDGVKRYQQYFSRRNKKMLKVFNSAYNYLHKFMGYDGDLNTQTASIGLMEAEELFIWLKKNTAQKGKKQ